MFHWIGLVWFGLGRESAIQGLSLSTCWRHDDRPRPLTRAYGGSSVACLLSVAGFLSFVTILLFDRCRSLLSSDKLLSQNPGSVPISSLYM